MTRLTALAFAAAMLATGLVAPTVAIAGCDSEHSYLLVDSPWSRPATATEVATGTTAPQPTQTDK